MGIKVIEVAEMEWADPIVAAPKKYGSLTFGTDIQKVDEMTERDSHTLSRMYKCIDSRRDALIFSTLDT